MPNWCQNRMIVSHMGDDLESYLKQEGFCFGKILPVAHPDVNLNADTWGTKWDLHPTVSAECGRSLVNEGSCYFDTAWAPPVPVVKRLTAMFPESRIVLHYYESGFGAAGSCFFNAGHCDEECVDFADKEALMNFLIHRMGWHQEDAAEEVACFD